MILFNQKMNNKSLMTKLVEFFTDKQIARKDKARNKKLRLCHHPGTNDKWPCVRNKRGVK